MRLFAPTTLPGAGAWVWPYTGVLSKLPPATTAAPAKADFLRKCRRVTTTAAAPATTPPARVDFLRNSRRVAPRASIFFDGSFTFFKALQNATFLRAGVKPARAAVAVTGAGQDSSFRW